MTRVSRVCRSSPGAMPRPLQFEVGLDGGSLEWSLLPGEATPACSSLECFGGLVRDRASAAATVVLAMTNAGFAPFWHNLRCSLERVNVSQHAIVIGTDTAACKAASSGSVPCVVGDQVLWNQDASDAHAGHGIGSSALSQEAEKHGTVAYARLMHVKALPALAVLRMGYNLLFTDTDVVWLRNPLHRLHATYGAALDGGELDVLIQSDYDESNEAGCEAHEHCARSAWCDRASGRCEDEACGGFYYLRSAPPAIAMLEALFERMAWQRSASGPVEPLAAPSAHARLPILRPLANPLPLQEKCRRAHRRAASSKLCASQDARAALRAAAARSVPEWQLVLRATTAFEQAQESATRDRA